MVAGRSKRAARLAATNVYVNWEMTHQYNLSCRTCRVAAGEGLPRELSGERFSDLLASVLSVREALGESSRLGFTFTGGEPTANPGLPSFVARARVEDCLDGGSARTHDLIRGEGTFRAAIEALRVAVEYTDLYVSTSLTVTGPSLPARQLELMRLLRALELQYLGRDFLVTYGEPFFGLTDPVEAFGELKYVERKAACGLATKAITLDLFAEDPLCPLVSAAKGETA